MLGNGHQVAVHYLQVHTWWSKELHDGGGGARHGPPEYQRLLLEPRYNANQCSGRYMQDNIKQKRVLEKGGTPNHYI